ncbi:glycoside hydrolase family 43 protein [Sediminibacterium ginsengisoli]|uniref:Beta-xylosidase n=1 Tax=Sediminibacterium ginsengisoli TaxID=413434 RepID=A0A1T4K2W8_9BACT|nr:glycoside hydrolase 43 family protein [Sediminibacterium ginsengisoli]SJZ36675.1 Beta-xylosidase [Sediminibacterium ginsengisoli]
MRRIPFILWVVLLQGAIKAQPPAAVSKVWRADNGNGTYKNPVLNADYSDPDAIRVGEDYYMIASSFEAIPGLPILHSKDLVNWSLIGHALKRQPPFDHFSVPRHGNGVWAPAIRFHKGEFYIYYPDPDFGIYLTKAKDPRGPWSEPLLVESGKGLIDPCPLWDEDGQTYLVHAWAGSRAGIKSIITIKKMNTEGTQVTDAGVLVYDGHENDPTIEGPKLYKRNGYYYIFAPAGGVSTGWQLVLRSKNIYGPYERKVVMDQGQSPVNGPHQGAWVTTQKGEDWFLHFQDKGPYGRVVHLQPMEWKNNWPVIGVDKDGDGKGEPVLQYRKPDTGRSWPVQTPPDTDEFNGTYLSPQWQWQANPKGTWAFMHVAAGVLRLFSEQLPDSAINLWDAPNVLLQKFPADSFMVTTKLNFKPNTKLESERTGLAIMGLNYATLGLKSTNNGIYLVQGTCTDAAKGNKEKEVSIRKITEATVYLRVKVTAGAICTFSYSTDGLNYTDAGTSFQAAEGRWIGAKVGLYCTRTSRTNDAGYADVDWFRVEPIK